MGNHIEGSGQGGRWISVGLASEMLGVTPQTIRNYCKLGVLAFHYTVGKHRRIEVRSVREYLGFDEEDDGEKKIILYCRVSTAAQVKSLNLARQATRLQEYAEREFSGSRETPLLIAECASGLSELRKGYLRMIDLVLSGNVSRVIVEHRDRLARYGVRLFEAICERSGTELIVTNAVDGVTHESEMATDIMSLVTVYSARLHGARGAEVGRIVIPDEAREKILRLYSEGLPQVEIVRRLKRDDVRCSKTNKVLSWHAVRLTLKALENEEQIKKVICGDKSNPIERFVSENCIRAKGEKCFTRPFGREYELWAKSQGFEIPTPKALTRAVKKLGFETGRNSSGYTYYRGLRLKNNERASRSHLG